jgi:hypothetical protein
MTLTPMKPSSRLRGATCVLMARRPKTAWKGLADELVPVTIEGRRADALEADLKHLTSKESRPPLRALYLARVSRTAGWISAVVLVDGRMIGT